MEEKYAFIDENGKEHNFEIIHLFEAKDNEYAVVRPEDIEEGLLLRLEYDKNGEGFLIEIEDENEFNEVSEIYMQIIDEE
ncbi:DUF1292 domain-containing protein [Clostridium sp. D2Q-14]|uniref:DUF1292 domain-containing protein n=1 Tax=Anaeromonas gelatinilytica TaxID=2683194 RepID=UPI00193B681A|nr:DUF1292 domain-containing protein [Anaeromonas gelatinilytica]MBS4535370.1 DUF1292 domain-containing protein [Anaeromonas gelatinilytica]